MNSIQKHHAPGLKIRLDHITRDLLPGGTRKRYIGLVSVSGRTSSSSIFGKAIEDSSSCHGAIGARIVAVHTGE